HAGCVEVLLRWGADGDQELPDEGTPLYAACVHQKPHSTGHASITKMLLEFGADINRCNAERQRPVDLAPPGGSTETLLMDHEVTPPTLRWCCRRVIRGGLGRHRLRLLPLLPLPPPLTHYLLYR
ncbi:hypothetical protein CRUP_027358, partial [Coryphaenoides rupestris]